MTSKASENVVATGSLRTLPGGKVVNVPIPLPKPCIVILIHGVNDVGEAFANQELGLCLGLSERLDRLGPGGLLRHAYYRVPGEKDRNAKDPDAVYFRRHHTKGAPGRDGKATTVNSPVIDFYWGFREEEGGYKDKDGNFRPWIDKSKPHGEYLDRYGNRLDKDSSKNGGPFANATSTLPDMWRDGFSGELVGTVPSSWVSPGKTRPLLKARERHYMVLAAQRLAMLVRMIRAKAPADTVNVVGHSQGCLITLLANAFLQETGDAPVDVLVMNHPPYGLHEPVMEQTELWQAQQTSHARLETLRNIVGFMTAAPRAVPAFAKLGSTANQLVGKGVITGARWQTGTATKTVDGKAVSFPERDNRGKVYLYFSPDDQTVGLGNVQGIGWEGVPDELTVMDAEAQREWQRKRVYDNDSRPRNAYERAVPALPTLGVRFKQRCFTARQRDGVPLLVGASPQTYVLETVTETAWSGTTLSNTDKAGRAGFWTGQSVRITGEALTPAVRPEMGSAWMDNSPIDASIAITREQQRKITKVMSCPWLAARASPSTLDKADLAAIERELNAGKDDVDQTRVTSAIHRGGGKVEVYRTETPNEARQRWMDAQGTDDNKNSFHSAIVSNPQHSRLVTAYDLAVGQAKAIDDPVYHLYLCLVADWRTKWSPEEVGANTKLSNEEKKLYVAAMSLRNAEGGHARKLIDETIEYRKTGKLPACAKCDLPTLVVSQTLGDREHGKESSTGTVRKVAMDDAAAEQQARDAALREANSRQIAADNAAINRLLRGEST